MMAIPDVNLMLTSINEHTPKDSYTCMYIILRLPLNMK